MEKIKRIIGVEQSVCMTTLQHAGRTYVAPKCVVIETCSEQLLAGTSIEADVSQPEHGYEGELSKENPWTFDETGEQNSGDIYFGEDY
jgi:hypothetical protein